MTQTPAGWYADPTPETPGSATLRYWDGNAWTAHVAPTSTPAALVAPAAPVGPTTPDGEPLAGWWWRVLAYVIDSVIVGFISGIAGFPAQIRIQQDLQPVVDRFSRQIEQNPEEPPDFGFFIEEYLDVLQANALWLVLPSLVITLVYFAVFLRWKGGTPGKLVLGLRVRLRDQPGTLPWWSIAARTAVQFGVAWMMFTAALVMGSPVLLLLGIIFFVVWLVDPLWATWDAKRQTIHDKAGRTNVVKIR